ncbi:chromate transporter [Imbroritus primus]|uniref:chromate transporter n=1 Tax=Imbroritus primus TaxID=3058603 RepID=UPI003D161607
MNSPREPFPPPAGRLFTEFSRMGLSGFGGVMPFVRRAIVERNRWMDDREFAELFSIAQVLPGPNVVNISLMLGYRYAGLRGAVCAFSGLVLVPMVLILVIASIYAHYSNLAFVRHMLQGMMAVSAGLVLATGIRMALAQPRTVRAAIMGGGALLAIGILRLPLVSVMAVMIPTGIAMEAWAMRRAARTPLGVAVPPSAVRQDAAAAELEPQTEDGTVPDAMRSPKDSA